MAQWAIWPDYTDVGPMVLVPAAALLWFTVSRAAWTPTPGRRTRTTAAVLLGSCAALAVVRAVGVLLWWAGTDEVSRASIGYVTGSGALLFNSGMLGQLWFAAVGGVLTWCLVVAEPDSGTVRRGAARALEADPSDPSGPPAPSVDSPGGVEALYRRPRAERTRIPAEADWGMALDRTGPNPSWTSAGEPPAEARRGDLIDGSGDEATPGSTVSAHYAGWAFSTGEEFDASWNRGAPLDFPLGAGRSSRAGTRASPV